MMEKMLKEYKNYHLRSNYASIEEILRIIYNKIV